MEDNSLPPAQLVNPDGSSDSLDVTDANAPVASYALNQKTYPIETLEVRSEGAAAKPSFSTALPTLRSVPFSRRRAVLISLAITLLVVIVTGFSVAYLVRKNTVSNSAAERNVPTQGISLKGGFGQAVPSELQGSEEALLVNGDVITTGDLKVKSGSFVSVLRTAQLTADRTLTLPNSSGTLCLDSNNCDFAGQAQVTQIQQLLNQIVIPALGVTALNDQTGGVSIQGSINQITVTTAGGVITLSTPQNLDANANVQFGSLALSGNATLGGTLTITGLGTGPVRATGGLLSVGAITLSSSDVTGTLAVDNGGTGAVSLTTDGVLVGNGTSAITSVTAGAPGECLLSTAGAPSFQACPGGGSQNVFSTINAPNGTDPVADNATDTLNFTDGTNITITGTAGSDTIDIATVPNPTFATSVTTPLLTSTGTLTVTPGGAMTIGATGQTALLQGSITTITSTGVGNDIILNSADTIELQDNTNVTGNLVATGTGRFQGATVTVGTASTSNGSLVLQNATNAFTVTLNGANQTTGSTVISFPDTGADTADTVCLEDVGNCSGVGTNSFETINTPNGTDPVADSSSDTLNLTDGSNITITGTAGTDTIDIATVQNPTFTTSVTTPLLTSTGTLTVTPGGAMTLGATGQTALLQGSVTTITSTGVGNDIVLNSADTIELQDNTNITGVLNVSGNADVGGTFSVGNNAAPTNIAAISLGHIFNGTNCGTFGCYGILANPNATNVTGSDRGIAAFYGTVAIGAGNLDRATALTAGNATGAGTVTTSYGLYVENMTKGATDDYGVYIQGADTYALWVDSGISRFDGLTPIQFSGAVDGDNLEFTLEVEEPTADRIYTIPNSTATSDTFCLFSLGNCAGSGGGVTGAGNNNRLAKFTSTGSTIGDSSISDNGSTVTLNGNVNLAVQGTNVTVGVGSSRTGSIVLQNSTNNNTVTLQSGVTSASYALTLPTAVGAANECLKAQNGTGTLFWDACLGGGGGGGITSVDGQTGPAIAINNATGAGNTITIDNAVADGATKGIAAFNATNFSAASGIINTIQGISTAATPQFAGLTLTGNLSVAANTITGGLAVIDFTNFDVLGNGNTTIGGTLGVSGATVTVGTASTSNGSLVLQNATNAFTVTLNGANQTTGSTVISFPDTGADTADTVCLEDANNCAGTPQNTFSTINAPAGTDPVADTASDTLNLADGDNITISGDSGTDTITVATVQNPTFTTSVTTPSLLSAATLSIASGSGDITVDGADEFIVQDAAVFNAQAAFNSDIDVVLADTENWSVGSTITGTNSVSVLNMSVTNNTSSGTQNLALLQNAAGSGVTDGLLVLDNADTDTVVSGGIVMTSAAGGITNAIDVSDSDITNALLFGANDIIGTNFTIAGATGTATLGSASALNGALVLQNSTNAFTVTVNAPNQITGSTTISIPNTGADTADTFCLQDVGNCTGSGAPTGASYLTLGLDGTLSAERVLTAGTNISFTDGGANGNLTVNTVNNPTFSVSVTSPLFTSTGTLAVTPGGAMTLGATGQTATLQGSTTTITSTGTLDIGANATAQTISIGNATGATAVAVLCGTGVCGFGNNAIAHTTTVGSATGGAITNLQAGTGGLNITTQGTTALSVGANAVAQTINIGNSTGATSVNISCGTGSSCNLGTNAIAHTTTIGSTTGASAVTIQCGTGICGIGNNATAHSTTVGSTTGSSTTTIQGGTTNGIVLGTTSNTPLTINSAIATTPNNLDFQGSESVLFIGTVDREVGIGTNAPDAKLHLVQNADGIGEGFRVKDSGSNAAVNIYYDNPGALGFIDVTGTYQMGHITSLPNAGQLNAGRVLTLKSFNESSLGGISFDIGGTEIARLNTNNQLVLSDGLVGTPALSFLNDTDTGVFRSGADDMRLVAGGQSQARVTANGIFIEERLNLGVDARTIATTGDASPATLTLNPNSSYVEITCNDPDTCDITLDEAAPVAEGQILNIVNVSANTVDFADTAGVTELAGAFAAGQYDTISMLYVDSTTLRWVELARSNN